MWKAVAVTLLGLLFGTVGLDPVRSMARFTFGSLTLQSGLDLVPMVMGLFGISEVFNMLERRLRTKAATQAQLIVPKGLLAVLPTRRDWVDARRPIGQGTLVGFFVGLLPGGGATISSYVAYAVAKQWSKPSQKFGAGAIGGVAAPEAAANAATCSGFIPLLTLGLPDNVVMALILGAFLLHGVTPGPTLMVQHPEMFWGIVTSMFIGNCILILTMLPLIGFLSKITLIPDNIVVAVIVLACLAGAYGVNNNPMDIVTMTAFGVLGYLMAKFGFPAAPMVLAFVLGPIMETSLRQSLIMSRGDFLVFWTRPVSAALMTVFVVVIALPLIRRAGGALLQRWSRPPASDAPPKSVIMTLLLVAGVLGFASTVRAEDYPAKPIGLVVPYPAGGRTDLTARAVAQFLKAELGQPVVVVNKPGASGVIGAKEVAGATPDGYTLGLFSTGFLTAQYMVPTPTNAAEYEFVALVNMDPAAIAVPRSREWQTLRGLVEYGRDHPGVLRVGINAGSSAHIFAAAFMDKAKLDVIYVPFRGGGERSVALAGGHIDVDFDIVAPMKPMVDSNKIRVLAIASDKRAEEYPDIPTMAESGVNLTISSWHGVFAPRGTSKAVVSRLSRALEHVCGNAEFIAYMRRLLLGVQYLEAKGFREFFAENDRINLDLIRALGLYVAPQR